MSTRLTTLAILAVLLAAAPARSGQGLNIDFGTAFGPPSASYGAASGQTGTWNEVEKGLTALVDVSGAPGTSVSVVASAQCFGQTPTSEEEKLLHDGFCSTGGLWGVTLIGLADGDYALFLYARNGGATGNIFMGNVVVPSLPGGPTLVEGTSWAWVAITVQGGSFFLEGFGGSQIGLAGLQLVPLAPGPIGINIDLGTAFGVPAAGFGAASGQVGSWNRIGVESKGMLDLGGAPTWLVASVSASFENGQASGGPPAFANQLLLNDNVYSNPGIGWSVYVLGMADGNYLVYLYAPSNTAVSTGDMNVMGQVVTGIPGEAGANLVEGVSWVKVPVLVTGGALFVAGGGVGFSGLAGLQIVPLEAVSYCSAGTSASGCTAALFASGTPSATASSGFDLSAAGVEGAKDGLFFFGTNGRQANPWGNGSSYQCVVPPVKRAGLIPGVGTTGACDGSFTQDLNALWCPACPKPGHNPGAGAVVQAQLWYRDPFNTSNQTTSFSDALEFLVEP